MRKRILDRWPMLAKLSLVLRVFEITDTVLGYWDRRPGWVKALLSLVMTVLIARWLQVRTAIWSWVEPNWRGFLFILAPLLIAESLLVGITWWRRRPQLPSKSSYVSDLKLGVRARIVGNGRVFDTPESDNPLWVLLQPSYAGGWRWQINLLFVNRESRPVNIGVQLAIPVRKDDPTRRFRVEPLQKPLVAYREEMRQYMYLQPEHLGFPVYIEPGKHVEGHVEFAVTKAMFDAIVEAGSFNEIVLAHERFLEVEDLLSDKKAEFKV